MTGAEPDGHSPAAAPFDAARSGGSLAAEEVPAAASAPQDLTDLSGVLQVIPFRRLWIALSVSSLGDWLGLLATTALAAELSTGFAAQNYAIGGVLFIRLLPAVLLGPLAGALADRLNRRITMVVADLIRAGFYISIPLVRSLVWLLIASFVIESVSLFWIPAKEASVPNLLPRERLQAANQLSLLTTYGSAPVAAAVFFVLSLLNSVLAAGISFFRTNSVDLALYFDGATFLFSAFTIFRLREIGRARRSEPDDGSAAAEPGLLRSITEGWRFVGNTPMVRGLVLGIVGAFAAGGAVVALGKQFTANVGGGNAAYGLLFGLVFIGLAGGMFLGPRLLVDFSRRRLFGLAILGAGVSLSVLAFLPNLVLALVAVVLIGAFAGIAWVVGYTLLGAEVADDVRGRTFALVQSLVRIDLLVVLALAPFAAGAIGVHVAQLGRVSLRLDGVTVVLFVGGLLAAATGFLSYRQMDDRRGVPLRADLAAALRHEMPTPPRRAAEPGLFVAFEGGEGAGKSTQVRLLSDWLRDQGYDPVVTREPGATAVGARLRELLLASAGRGPSPRTEALLYAADRCEHVDTVVRPALDRGAVVVTDRYVDSTLAYQGAGRQLPAGELRRISRWACGGLIPDLTVLLDVPAEVGRARGGAPTDRIEGEPADFHERVRRAFLALAEREPKRYLVVDATMQPETVAQLVRERLAARLPAQAPPAAAGGRAHGSTAMSAPDA